MLRDYLRLQLLNPASGLMTSGVPIVIGGVPSLLYATLRILISDGDGHRCAFHHNWRRLSGWCSWCSNIFMCL